jgi:hypothetical protein
LHTPSSEEQREGREWDHPHTGSTHHISKLQTRVVLLVIPVLVVDPLSQQLDGRLGSILLLLRHVQVIHKHQTSAVQKIQFVLSS